MPEVLLNVRGLRISFGTEEGTVRALFGVSFSVAPAETVGLVGESGCGKTVTALSFLGIGVQPPTPSWGNILTAGKDNIEYAWWLSLFPGLAILVTVLGYNLLGEGIRDAADPRLKGR